MFCSRLMKEFKFLRIRQIHSTIIKYEEKAAPDKANKPSGSLRMEEDILGSPLHTCTNLDKKILVWVKRFPSLAEVPDQVTIDCMQKAHTKARVRVCFILMGISIAAFIGSVIMGKRDVASGKNILTERLKYYEKVREQANAEKQNKGKE
ncbi:protein FAM162B [Megachile rotundata]|uniref:protein FAM162B n=1 Tax=Megachile rotundata TaxID=143995 RepID=UPI000258F2FD|nr:PREDICTED: protein FAM162B-like [Megachile rotundata]